MLWGVDNRLGQPPEAISIQLRDGHWEKLAWLQKNQVDMMAVRTHSVKHQEAVFARQPGSQPPHQRKYHPCGIAIGRSRLTEALKLLSGYASLPPTRLHRVS